MNASSFFSLGLNAMNTAYKVGDVSKAVAAKATTLTKSSALSAKDKAQRATSATKECSMSFMDGVRAAREMNKALNK